MTPILYEKDEIDFTSQGLGALAEIYDVDVAEQRNGLFQLTANYPVTGIRYDDISVGRIILAKPNQRDEPHAFRIVNTELDVMGYSLMIEADSITYDLNHNFIKHLTVNDATGQVMMSALQAAIVNPSIFTFYSDINHKSSTKLDYVNPMEAVMGVQGSFLQYWGGELKRENRRVAMFNRRGRDNVATFRLGKNISGLKYKVDISSLVTRIMPVKSVQENDKTTYLEGTPVSSKYINNYEQIYTIKVDFTDDTIKTVDDLNKAAEGWFVDSANTGRDKPSVTIDIDVLSLQDSADYQDKFKNLESVALTDTVTVYVPEYGVNVTAIVNEIHFDPIQERVTKLVVGTAKQSFADSSRVQLSDLQGKIISVQEQADQIAVSANNKNSNYYGSVAPSHPQEGDFWYWKNGDLSGIKQFVNGDWADVVDSNTQQHIADSVNQAVQDAQKYSDKLVADNAEQVNRVLSDVQDKQLELKNEQGELDRKAQGYANKALEDAKADALKTTQDLVSSIQTEVDNRVKAVSDLDKKATDAINQAKEDAQSAVNALQIGGRNYLLNSNGSSLSGWSAPSLWSITTDPVKGSVFMGQPTVTWTGGGMNSLSQATTKVPVGSTVTVSFYAKANVDNARFHSEPLGTVVSFNPRLTTEWEHYTYTYTMGANNQRVYFMPVDAGTTYYLDDIKLEIGNKATDYTQSPEDVVMDYTTKDNEIKRTLTQYQEANDGRVSTAQSAVNQALGELSTKVSKTTFDQKTGDLENKYSTIKQTADNISADITNIQNTDRGQDRRMANIEADANGIKSTVSSIQKTQGQQSGSISTLQQTADKLEATVSTLGQVNQLFNTEFSPDFQGWYTGNSSTSGTYKTGLDLASDTSWAVEYGKKNGSTVLKRTYGTGNSSFFSNPILVGPGVTITGSILSNSTAEFNGTVSAAIYFRYYDSQLNYIGQDAINSARNTNWTQTTLTRTTPANTLYVVFNILTNGSAGVTYYSQPMLTFTDKVGAYVAGNYNNNASVAKAQMTADEAKRTITSYQTTADGRISSAESKIKQNAEAITTKVSQTEYNQKTGQIEGAISSINQTANTITQSVSTVQTQVNSLKQVNLVNNSQMALDYSGWHLGDPWGTAVTNDLWNNGIADNSGAMYVWHNSTKSGNWIHSDPVPVNGGQVVSASITAAMPNKPTSGTPLALYIRAYDANKAQVTSLGYNIPLSDLSATFTTFKLEGQTLASTARYVSFVLAWNVGGDISFGKPMLVLGNKVGDYVPGPYVNNDKVATQQITINSITNTVSEQGKDLSKITSRVQTAEGYISTAKNDISGLQSSHTQTANQLSTEINDRKNGDTNTLTQAKNFTTSSITSSEGGMRSLITQTSDAIIAQIGNTNLVTNSEFDPDNKGWYRLPAGGATIGDPIKTPVTGFFADWDATNGSRGIVFGNETGTWMTSEPVKVSPSGTYSISLLAGRPAAPTVAVTMDFRLGIWDKDKKFIASIGGSNPMNGTTYLPLRYYKRENITIPSDAYYVSFVLGHSGTGTPDAVYQPMINHGATIAKYTPTYGTSSSSTILSLLKDNWSIGIIDNAGKLASGVFGDINGMTLNGKTVTINANQTVITGTAFITDAMISTMSASKLTAGTIDASNINVTNINASNIVSGAISGANLNINLNTGQVVFQRGRIYNASVEATDYTKGGIDINIDKRYLASSNGSNVAMLYDGQLSLIQEGFFTGPTSIPYFEISNHGGGFDFDGAALTATEKLLLTTKGDVGSLGLIDGRYLNGLVINKKEPTRLGGLGNGVIISGGQGYTDLHNIFGYAPHILVGVDQGAQSTSEIHMYSSWIRASAVEERTTSAGANVNVASDGTLVRSSSSSKYKLDIEYEQQAETANKLLTLDPATWHDKFESEQLDKFHEIGVDPERAIDMSNRRYYGIIAEDLVKAGLEHFVSRNVMTGEVEGVEYSKIGVALIPIIRELRNRLNEQYVEIERLKEQFNE